MPSESKRKLFVVLDRRARRIAGLARSGKNVTRYLLKLIHQLYEGAKSERKFQNQRFECAYHNPITSELEFLIARTIYHTNPRLKVYLRRQVDKMAPDIRIERGGRTVAVIELKSKAGWIQPFFSADREVRDQKKFEEGGKSAVAPKVKIAGVREQLLKYVGAFRIRKSQVFMLLPSLAHVHRKRSTRKLRDYRRDFARNSTLSRDNLILLSNLLTLDLSLEGNSRCYEPTDRLERFLGRIRRL